MFWRRNAQGLALVALALALIGGETAGFAAPRLSPLWPWAACLAAFAMCAAIGWRVPFARFLVAAGLGVSLAWRSECGRIALDRRAHMLGAGGTPPAFDLTVEGEVVRRPRPQQGGWMVHFDSRIGGMAVRVVAPVRADGRVPKAGEVWRCTGWLSLKKSAPSRYAPRKLWVMAENHMERLSSARGISAQVVYRRLSDRLARYTGTGLGWCPGLASFSRAMLLGRRSGVTMAKRKAFASAGTLHVFAISGLHVMLVAGVLKGLLSCARLPPRLCAALTIPFLAGYVMLSGARPSAMRAMLMMTLWLGSGLFGRRPDSLAAWGNTALLVYGLSPKLVFDAGCALSFMVMLGIVLWLRWASQFATPLDWMQRIAVQEQALGDDRRAVQWAAWRRRGLRILGLFGISFAAWIAGTPVMARAFGSLTLGGLVANVVVVPLAGMAVTLGAFGIVASLAAPPLGMLFNALAAICIWLMERLSEAVAACPGIAWETLPWSWRDCCLWYGAWLALFVVLSRHLPPREWMPVLVWRQERSDEGNVESWGSL